LVGDAVLRGHITGWPILKRYYTCIMNNNNMLTLSIRYAHKVNMKFNSVGLSLSLSLMTS